MLKSMMDTFFLAVVVMLAVAGSAHTVMGFYLKKKKQQRWRELAKRLKLGESNA